MGHLVNPISSRLSIISYWKSSWSVYNLFTYTYLLRQDLFLFKFIDWFFEKKLFFQNNFVLSHYKLFKVKSAYYINFYYYFSKSTDIKDFFFSSYFKILGVRKLNLFFETRFNFCSKVLLSNFFWKLLFFIFSSQLKTFKLPFNFNFNEFYFNIYSLNYVSVTPNIITRYISLKLQQKHRLAWVLKPILKDLSWKYNVKLIGGFKILTAGRFTRKQIASYSWTKGGNLPLNTLNSVIKYSFASVRLKYGVCGIKVWINYSNDYYFNMNHFFKLIYPFYKPFNFYYLKNKNLIFFQITTLFYFYLNYLLLYFSRYNTANLNYSALYKSFLHRSLYILMLNLFSDTKTPYSSFSLHWLSSSIFMISLNTNTKKNVYIYN